MVKILLDNGHGYDTPGKRSPIWPDGSQLFEWEFNRDIVSRIEILLKKAGISCVRLVPEKEDISLSERSKRANTIAKQSDCLLISIHANAGGGSGGEVFTYSGSHKSKSYAEIFRDLWKNHFPELRFRGCKEENFGILRESVCPALLTENLFMDNYADCKILLSKCGREKIARWHAESIQTILKRFYQLG